MEQLSTDVGSLFLLRLIHANIAFDIDPGVMITPVGRQAKGELVVNGWAGDEARELLCVESPGKGTRTEARHRLL
jgi:hypothetical protein